MTALLVGKLTGDENVYNLEHPVVGDGGYQVIGGIDLRYYFPNDRA